ncbi:MAG: PAS domain-containing protein [Alphaproteobacteria bacterium]
MRWDGTVIPYDCITFQETLAEAERLSGGDRSTVEEWFTSTGISKPVVIWEPSREELVTNPIVFLYDYWHARKATNEIAMRSSDVDPSDLVPALGYIMLLDILEDGRDFRYRLFGSKIAEIANFDSTGLRISETKAHPLMKAFFSTIYQAVLIRPCPIYTEHNPPPDRAFATWHRIVLPLHDGTGKLDRFLVGNVPTPYHGPDVRQAAPFQSSRTR